jgi:hypothetical protein
MIAPPPGVRVWLACGRTDTRKYAGQIVMRSWPRLAQQFVLHAELAQALIGGTQRGLHRIILCAVLEPGLQCGKGALAPLLQSVGLDGNLARDSLDRLIPQQSQDDVSLAGCTPS